MSWSTETARILSILGSILAVASLIGFVLHLRHRTSATIANLNSRIRTWWVIVGVLAGAFLAGRFAVVALFALISFLALREFATLAAIRRADHRALLASFFVALPGQYYLVAIGWYGLFAVFIPVYAFLVLPILAALAADSEDFLARAAETQWGLMISVYCLSHIPALLMLDVPEYGHPAAMLIVFLIVVTQASDVLQYVWGKLLGRRKIVPALSPSKTVEGFAGGVASAVILSTLLYRITPFEPLAAAAMGLTIALMGFLGGLVMSAIKRDMGVKDWGQCLPGHGGILDRLDSLCFAAPVFFHLTRYFYAG